MIWENSDSNAQADASIDRGDTNISDRGSDPIRCLHCAFYARSWQKDEELLPAVSASEVAGAKGVGERGADGCEDVVTSAVTESVVDLLEVI